MVSLKPFFNFNKMKKITKETILAEHNKTPRRKCFRNNSGIQKRKSKPTFSVHIGSAKKIFEAQTGKRLRYNPAFDNYWEYISEEEIVEIEAWEKAQGGLIYLRDCLSLSVALDSNRTDNTSGQYTQIGLLE